MTALAVRVTTLAVRMDKNVLKVTTLNVPLETLKVTAKVSLNLDLKMLGGFPVTVKLNKDRILKVIEKVSQNLILIRLKMLKKLKIKL